MSGSGTRRKQKRSKQPFDEAAAGFAAGAVGHFDLGVAKADSRRRLDCLGWCRSLRLSAIGSG